MMAKLVKPYIPEESKLPEFTLKAIVLGVLMAVVLGAASACGPRSITGRPQ